MTNKTDFEKMRAFWDEQAQFFDEEPDHGLNHPDIKKAWNNLLRNWLKNSPLTSHILDVGCGTGSLSLALAEMGHIIKGIDYSSKMIAKAKLKSQLFHQSIEFKVMDACDPGFPPQSFDAIVCRHLLWALPTPQQAVNNWIKLLNATGRILLIEGFWHTGVGLHSDEILQWLSEDLKNITVLNLSSNSDYWGKHVDDERFAITAEV